MRHIQLILTILGCIVYKYIAQAFLGYSHDDLSNFIDNKLLPNYEKSEFICYEHQDWQALTKIFSSASMLCFIENNPLIAIIIDIHYIQYIAYIARIIVNLINS